MTIILDLDEKRHVYDLPMAWLKGTDATTQQTIETFRQATKRTRVQFDLTTSAKRTASPLQPPPQPGHPHDLWYSKREIAAMRKASEQMARAQKQQQQQHQQQGNSLLVDSSSSSSSSSSPLVGIVWVESPSFSARGLEDVVSIRWHCDKKARKASILQAVLREQERQVTKGVMNPETIRKRCARTSQESMAVAHQWAQYDAQHARQIWGLTTVSSQNEATNPTTTTTLSATPSSCSSGTQPPEPPAHASHSACFYESPKPRSSGKLDSTKRMLTTTTSTTRDAEPRTYKPTERGDATTTKKKKKKKNKLSHSKNEDDEDSCSSDSSASSSSSDGSESNPTSKSCMETPLRTTTTRPSTTRPAATLPSSVPSSSLTRTPVSRRPTLAATTTPQTPGHGGRQPRGGEDPGSLLPPPCSPLATTSSSLCTTPRRRPDRNDRISSSLSSLGRGMDAPHAMPLVVPPSPPTTTTTTTTTRRAASFSTTPPSSSSSSHSPPQRSRRALTQTMTAHLRSTTTNNNNNSSNHDSNHTKTSSNSNHTKTSTNSNHTKTSSNRNSHKLNRSTTPSQKRGGTELPVAEKLKSSNSSSHHSHTSRRRRQQQQEEEARMDSVPQVVGTLDPHELSSRIRLPSKLAASKASPYSSGRGGKEPRRGLERQDSITTTTTSTTWSTESTTSSSVRSLQSSVLTKSLPRHQRQRPTPEEPRSKDTASPTNKHPTTTRLLGNRSKSSPRLIPTTEKDRNNNNKTNQPDAPSSTLSGSPRLRPSSLRKLGDVPPTAPNLVPAHSPTSSSSTSSFSSASSSCSSCSSSSSSSSSSSCSSASSLLDLEHAKAQTPLQDTKRSLQHGGSNRKRTVLRHSPAPKPTTTKSTTPPTSVPRNHHKKSLVTKTHASSL